MTTTAAPQERPKFPFSQEQQVVVDAACGSADNLLISAPAGALKTSTMCAVAAALGPGRRVAALAFNKDASLSLAERMPYWVESTTFHAFCNAALSRHVGRRLTIDGTKTRKALRALVPDWHGRREIEDDVLTLVSRAKATGYACDLPDVPSLNALADRFGLDLGSREIAIADEILSESSCATIDFDDMLWLSLREKVVFPPVALILLDEAQDTNAVQRALLQRILWHESPNSFQPNARLIAVGDPHQSIYGFRGADSDAMVALRDDFNMKELALSVSYRCSQAVVREAQKYL